MKLGVNIDHVATLRQARYRTQRRVEVWAEPHLLDAARAVERAGAHGITLHLREDRRHIQDDDVWLMKRHCRLPLNLEMAANLEILGIVLRVRPKEVCIVPERRQEVTTEGGLDVLRGGKRLQRCITALQKKDVLVSLFIAPDERQIRAASKSGAEFIELHTGSYADAHAQPRRKKEISRLLQGAALAVSLGLRINAGHGLRCANLKPILRIPGLETLNIGHSIVSRSIMIGLEAAVREMLQTMRRK
jgi:pyridoxine 5-phosphate synthase